MGATKPGPLCSECTLRDQPGVVWGEGQPGGAAFIGMNPAEVEIQERRPFAGPAGQVHNRTLQFIGWSRSETFTSNIVKCRTPSNRPPTKHEVECCRPLLIKEIQAARPKIIAALGADASEALTGKRMSTVTLKDFGRVPRGKQYDWQTKVTLRGCVEEPLDYIKEVCAPTVRVIPTIHPSGIARAGFRDLPFLREDYRKTKRWAEGGGIIVREELNYNPTSSEVADYVERCRRAGEFGLDIETPPKVIDEEEAVAKGPTEITVIGLSCAYGSSIGVPPNLFDLVWSLISDPSLTCFMFNAGFDQYRLATHAPFKCKPLDVMLMLHLLMPIARPKDMGMAGSLFTDMPYWKSLSKVQPDVYNARDTYGNLWAGQIARARLQKEGMWKLFQEHAMDLWPIVKGMYMRVDKERAIKQYILLQKAKEQYEAFWNKTFPSISWSSPKQLGVYYYDIKKIPEITMKRGKDKPKTRTVDEDALNIIATRYGQESAKLVILLRKLEDTAEFYTRFDEEGWARPKVKIHGQTQGRLQMKEPNLQSIPEEMLKSDGFEGFHPREVYIPDTEEDWFIYADLEQVEHWITCYYAGDTDYLKIKEQGLYLHGINQEEILGVPFFQPGKPKMKKYKLPDLKPQDLLLAKALRHGLNYGRQWKGITDDLNKKGIPLTYDQARSYCDKDRRSHPAIYRMHERVVGEATRQGYLRNAFARIRPFAGTERNEILSFLPQSTTVDVLIRNLLRPMSAILPDFGPRARIVFSGHDSGLINGPRKRWMEIARLLKEKIEAPIEELGGLVINAEIYQGPNWYDLKPVDFS